MTFRSCTKWAAIILAALAGLSLTLAVWSLGRGDRALSWPIQLVNKFTLQRQFDVWRNARYRISVYCSGSAEREHVRKVLQGGNLVRVELAENGTAVPLDYFPEPLFRPGIVSTAEWGNIVLGPDEVGQDIADFSGDPAKHYQVTCSTIRSVAELDQMYPKLVIALDPLEGKGDMFSNLFLLVATAAAAILALVASVIYVAIDKRRA